MLVKNAHSQKGAAITYIIGAIALLALFGASLLAGGSRFTSADDRKLQAQASTVITQANIVATLAANAQLDFKTFDTDPLTGILLGTPLSTTGTPTTTLGIQFDYLKLGLSKQGPGMDPDAFEPSLYATAIARFDESTGYLNIAGLTAEVCQTINTRLAYTTPAVLSGDEGCFETTLERIYFRKIQ